MPCKKLCHSSRPQTLSMKSSSSSSSSCEASGKFSRNNCSRSVAETILSYSSSESSLRLYMLAAFSWYCTDFCLSAVCLSVGLPRALFMSLTKLSNSEHSVRSSMNRVRCCGAFASSRAYRMSASLLKDHYRSTFFAKLLECESFGLEKACRREQRYVRYAYLG